MVARVFEIQSRQRQRASIVSRGDFESIANGTIETQSILENPRISLYCIDNRQRQAVFVETPLDIIALSQQPFFLSSSI